MYFLPFGKHRADWTLVGAFWIFGGSLVKSFFLFASTRRFDVEKYSSSKVSFLAGSGQERVTNG